MMNTIIYVNRDCKTVYILGDINVYQNYLFCNELSIKNYEVVRSKKTLYQKYFNEHLHKINIPEELSICTGMPYSSLKHALFMGRIYTHTYFEICGNIS